MADKMRTEDGNTIVRYGNKGFDINYSDDSFHFDSYVKVAKKAKSDKGYIITTESGEEIEITSGYIYNDDDMTKIRAGSVLCFKFTVTDCRVVTGYSSNYIQQMIEKYFEPEKQEAREMLVHLNKSLNSLYAIGLTTPNIMAAIENIREEIEICEKVIE